MGKATQIPEETFNQIQTDAGILIKSFDPSSPETVDNEDIVCATTGGFTVNSTASYSDMGDDVDNCPVNTMELKHLDSWDINTQFTAISITPEVLKMSLGAADISDNKITPRRNLKQSDFEKDLWWIGDMADGGLVVAHLMNVLSTSGLSLKTQKNSKGNLSVTLGCHVSIKNQDVVPVEFFVIEGSEATALLSEEE